MLQNIDRCFEIAMLQIETSFMNYEPKFMSLSHQVLCQAHTQIPMKRNLEELLYYMRDFA
jgi:hypothetical protein